MHDLLDSISDWFTPDRVAAFVRAGIVLVVGLILAKVAAAATNRSLRRKISAQNAMIARRVVRITVSGLVIVIAMREIGFDLSILVGAAGVLTVAIGFASQTSASNIISGLFLMGEEPFVIGDVIQLGETTGEVIAINMLSVRLRTFDNLLVRIPNEKILKSELVNLTHFPIRRLDIKVGVAYREDLARVREVLDEVAEHNPICLDHPEPLFIFLGFGDSSLNLQFSVWAARERFLELRNSIQAEIKVAFEEAGIEIPFPQRVVTIEGDPRKVTSA